MNKQFAARLRSAIRATNLNATRFASRAGIPQGTISKCLNGHVPTARILMRISKLSAKSVDWLLTGREERGTKNLRVAEAAGRYRRAAAGRRPVDEEGIWVAKLLKVLRSGDRQRKQTIKDLLDMLSR